MTVQRTSPAAGPRTLVVGGGAMGSLIARELALRGGQVSLVEPADGRGQASWAGAGLLSTLPPWAGPAPVRALAEASLARYPALCAELAAATGVDPELDRPGVLWLDPLADEQLQEGELADEQLLATAGAERWSAAQAARRHPEVAACAEALWLPGILALRNPRLLRALSLDLEARGVARVVAEVTAVQPGASGWQLWSSAGDLEAERVVLAAGAWTPGLLAPLGYRLPVRPVRGQILLLEAQAPYQGPVLLRGEHYAVPRRDGLILVGATVEEAGFDPRTTPEALDALRAGFRRLLPELPTREVMAWAGLRPGSPGGVPFVGEVPGHPGLFVCTGHHRAGLTMAPASAELVADLVLEQGDATRYGDLSLPAAA